MSNKPEEAVVETPVPEPKPKKQKKVPVVRTDMIVVDGVEYQRFALIAERVGVAFQQVYQRAKRAKNPMRYVEQNGILYGAVDDIEPWIIEREERVLRVAARKEEKAAAELARAAKAAEKATAAAAAAEAQAQPPQNV